MSDDIELPINDEVPNINIPSLETMTIPDNFKLIFSVVTPVSSAKAHLQLSAEPKYNPYIALFGMYPNYVPKLTQAISVKDSLVFNKNVIFKMYCDIYHLDAKAFAKEDGVDIVTKKVINNIVNVVTSYLTHVAYKDSKIGVGFQLMECLNKKEFIHPIYTHDVLNNANDPTYQVVALVETSDGEEHICYLTENDGFTSKPILASRYTTFPNALRAYKRVSKLLTELPMHKRFVGIKRNDTNYQKRTISKYTLTITEEEHSSMVLGVKEVIDFNEDKVVETVEAPTTTKKKTTTKSKAKTKKTETLVNPAPTTAIIAKKVTRKKKVEEDDENK